jgi:choline kinase
LGEKLTAVIVAEGGSQGLRPLTEHLPTSLVPVGGVPILDCQIRGLRRQGIRDLTVIGGYRAAQVEQVCRLYPRVRFLWNPRYSRGEPRLAALRPLGGRLAGPLLLLRGELFFDRAILGRLLAATAPSAVAVGPDGRGIGLLRLSTEVTGALFELVYGGTPGQDPELFRTAETLAAAGEHESVTAGDEPWARVDSMEGLARALRAHSLAGSSLAW